MSLFGNSELLQFKMSVCLNIKPKMSKMVRVVFQILLFLAMNFIFENEYNNRLLHSHLEILNRINTILLVEGHMTRTRSEFENELGQHKVQFVRIRDKNANFILCQFQRFVLYLQKECFEFLF